MSNKNCIAEIAVNKPRLINRPFWLLSELDGYYAILMVLNCNLTTKLTYRDEAHRTSGRVVSPERSRRACPASCGAALSQVLLLCATVMTTFPRACPSPRYRRASGTSLKG